MRRSYAFHLALLSLIVCFLIWNIAIPSYPHEEQELSIKSSSYQLLNVSDSRPMIVKTQSDLDMLHDLVLQADRPPGHGYVNLTFADEYRNPCWDIPVDIKCFPAAFLAGFPKAGTTDLYRHLILHPDIVYVKPKEPHFWVRSRHRQKNFTYYTKIYGNYFFNLSLTEPETARQKIAIDASGSTIWDNQELFPEYMPYGYKDPPLLNVHYIKSALPNTKWIIIVRNPTQRMYSHYNFFCRNTSPEEFHRHVVDAVRKFKECLMNGTTLFCVYAKIHQNNKVFDRLRTGLYDFHIRQLVNAGYNRNQILVLQLEEYKVMKHEQLNKVFKFLDLRTLSESDLTSEEYPQAFYKGHYKPMLNESKELLDDFYRPYNTDFARSFNIDYNENVNR